MVSGTRLGVFFVFLGADLMALGEVFYERTFRIRAAAPRVMNKQGSRRTFVRGGPKTLSLYDIV